MMDCSSRTNPSSKINDIKNGVKIHNLRGTGKEPDNYSITLLLLKLNERHCVSNGEVGLVPP